MRVIGDPHEHAVRYANNGADELLFMDTVASLYGRNQLSELIERTTDGVFVPVTVGGGIRSLADVKRMFDSGADKVAINTFAVKNPSIIKAISDKYGAQAIVVSIEAKKTIKGWEVYTDNGRERTGMDAVEWAFEAQSLGAGEILLTSIDREGTRKGADLELSAAICPNLDIPVIISGGIGSPADVEEAKKVADAVAVADILHYKRFSLSEIRHHLSKS